MAAACALSSDIEPAEAGRDGENTAEAMAIVAASVSTTNTRLRGDLRGAEGTRGTDVEYCSA
jgi:hypothetical protein